MVEVVTVVVVDLDAQAAGTNERVEGFVLEPHMRAGAGLVIVGAADGAGLGDRVVLLADVAEQHQAGVVVGERAQRDDIGRLDHLATLLVEVAHAGGSLAVVGLVDLGHVTLGNQGEVLAAHQRRDHTGLGRGL
ncbi:hypothetical protein D3C80_1368670 [compost metagenome]